MQDSDADSDFTIVQKMDRNLNIMWAKRYSKNFSLMSAEIDHNEAFIYYIIERDGGLEVHQIDCDTGEIVKNATIDDHRCNDIYCQIQISTDDYVFFTGKQNSNGANKSVICRYSFITANSVFECMRTNLEMYPKFLVLLDNGSFLTAYDGENSLKSNPVKVLVNIDPIQTSSNVSMGCPVTYNNCQTLPAEAYYNSSSKLVYMCDIYKNHGYSVFTTLSIETGTLLPQKYTIYSLSVLYKMFAVDDTNSLYLLGKQYNYNALLRYDTESNQFTSKYAINVDNIYDGLSYISSDNSRYLLLVGEDENKGIKLKTFIDTPHSHANITERQPGLFGIYLRNESISPFNYSAYTSLTHEVHNYTPNCTNPSSTNATLQQLLIYTDYLEYNDVTSPNNFAIPKPVFPCTNVNFGSDTTYDTENCTNYFVCNDISSEEDESDLIISIPEMDNEVSVQFYLVATRESADGIETVTEILYTYITMNILVKSCQVQHCEACLTNNIYSCETCADDYIEADEEGEDGNTYYVCEQIPVEGDDDGSEVPDVEPDEEEEDDPIPEPETEIIEEEAPAAASVATQGAAAASAGAAIVSSLSNLSSPQGLWMSMNQFQLIMLLLLTNAYVPFKVVDYLAGMKSTTCSFGFIPFKKIPGFKQMIHWFDYKVDYEKLDYFGVESGSTFVNVFNVCCVFLIIFIFHAIFLVIYKILYNPEYFKRKERLNKIWYIFALTIYIRLFLQASQFLFLSSFSEIYEMDFSHDNKILSFAIAGVSAVLLIGCFLCSIWKWIKNSDYYDDEDPHMFKEFFTGLKNKHRARAYSTMLLMRRIVFIIFLIAFKGLDVLAQLILIFLAQLAYFSVMVWIRPFKEFKNNLMEIINELFFISLIIMLLMYNKKSDWRKKAADAYLGLIMVNSAVIMAILFLAIIVQLVKKCFKKKSKTEPKPQIVADNTQRSISTPHTASNISQDRPSFSLNSATNNFENANFEVQNSPANFPRNQPQRKKDWCETYEYDPNRANRQRQMNRTIE